MLAVKSMDVCENFKEWCNKVINGETFIVSKPKMKVFRLYVTINGSQAAHSNDSDIPDGLTAKTVWCMLLTNCKIFQLCPARAIMIAKTLLLKISGGGTPPSTVR